MVEFSWIEIIWYLLLPISAVLWYYLRRLLMSQTKQSIKFVEWLLPIVILGINELSLLIFRLSLLPYLLFIWVCIGLLLVFYHYQKDTQYHLKQFLSWYILSITYLSSVLYIGLILGRVVLVLIGS